jgi:hypothetical protein
MDETTPAELQEFILKLANHIFLCFEILAHKAEKRPRPVITEHDYCPLDRKLPE